MRKKKKRNGNGMMIILLITCIGVVFVLIRTLIGREVFYIGRNGMTDTKMQAVGGIPARESVTVSVAEDGANVVSTNGENAEDEEYSSETDLSGAEVHFGEVSGEKFMGETVPVIQAGPVYQMEPEIYEFTVSDKSYFDDALFIGDSRTVGLREYGTLDNADYFASPGLNLYKIERTKVLFKEEQNLTLEEILSQNEYGKLYVMLGINELGYDFDTTVGKYEMFIDYLFTMQPDAILYVCANLHVNSLRNEVDEIHNNGAINRINEVIAGFADQKNIFYLDVNPIFDDEEGNLSEEFISDDSHLLGTYYETWCDWYCENTIVKNRKE